MNLKDIGELNCDIFFSISELYKGRSYSTYLPPIAGVKFKITFELSKNQLKMILERNTLELSTYSIKISNYQSDPTIAKFDIRFDQGKTVNEITIRNVDNYIIDSQCKINFQMEAKTFNSPKYPNKKNPSQHSKKQSKLSSFFAQTTEDHLGLSNQGATCYLNSLLQVLFHLKIFRKMIYSENAEHDESNFIFCLQLLFRDIQLRKTRRSTRHLTNSLGWDKKDVFTSQDVSEFYKFLFENVLKGKPVTSLFEGEYDITITNSRNVKREAKEKFIQVLLRVEGFDNLVDSFKSLFFPFSFLDNQGANGTEESIKQISISELPPVLTVVLKRFWFNEETKRYEKLNSILVFPNILELSEVGVKSANSNYQLYAIIAHIGTLDAGHYVSFINPDLRGNWYEFDDSKVYKLTDNETFDLCYGRNRMNAYMLFYVDLKRKDEFFNINSLLTFSKGIQNYKYSVIKSPPIQFYMNNEDGIAKNMKKLKPSYLNLEVRKILSFDVGTSFLEIYNSVASLWKKEPNSIRIWNIKNDSLLSVFNRNDKLKKTENNCWFVQNLNEDEELLVDENHFVAFISFYLPETQQKLFYLGSQQFCLYDPISSIEKVVSEKFLLKNFPLISFVFKKEKIINLSTNNTSLQFIHLGLLFNGLFFIVQAQPGREVSINDFSIDLSNQIENDSQIESEIEFSDNDRVNIDFVDSYIRLQYNQVTLYIYNFLNQEKPLIKLNVSKGCSPSRLKSLISLSAGFGFDEKEDTILLFNKGNTDKYLDEESLNYILQKGNSKSSLCFLIYKGVKEINTTNQMKILISYRKNKQIPFFIDKDEPLRLILQNLIDNRIIPDNKIFRAYLVDKSRIITILNDNDVIPNKKFVLYVEEIPKYQMEEDILILKVSQSFKDGDELVCFGDPFIIGIKFEEICVSVKERICNLIGCEMKNLNILIKNDIFQKDSYRLLMNDENVLDSLDGNNELFAFFD